ncbi:MAG: DUF2179 domain-containing protein [Bacteroidales bacterium]
MDAFLDGATFTYIMLPLLIFLARVADVSIGTIRIVMVSKGHKFFAPILGFFEILIWLMAISKIFENLDNWACFFGYALGFATGNYVGLCIEEKLAVGIVKLQIITRHNAEQLIENLIKAGYGITHHDAQGSSETVSIIYSMIKRSEIKRMEEIIKSTNPKAFYSIEDVKAVKQGVFPASSPRWRKGK